MQTRSFLSLLLLGSMLLPTATAATLQGETIVIDQQFQENLYVTGSTVVITEPVVGDVVAFAGDLVIQAPIQGDVVAAAGTVSIEAPVSGDVRVAATRLLNEKSSVGGDVVYFGSQLAYGAGASASGAVMAQAGQIIFQGQTGTGVQLSASDLTFGGLHGGQVELSADTLQFMGGTVIEGVLEYAATQVTDITAVQAASIEKLDGSNDVDTAVLLTQFAVMGVIITLAGLLIAALLSWATPTWSRATVARMQSSTLFSVFLGIFTLFFIPSFLGFLFASQVVFAPWALILLPLMVLIGAIYVALIVLSLGMSALLWGTLLQKLVRKPMHPGVQTLLGALVFGVLILLPVVGFFIAAGCLTLSVGAMVQSEERYLGILPRRK